MAASAAIASAATSASAAAAASSAPSATTVAQLSTKASAASATPKNQSKGFSSSSSQVILCDPVPVLPLTTNYCIARPTIAYN